MDRNSYDKNRTFLHLRQEGKLDLARLFEAGVLESKRGYTPEEFKFLINTLHIDPENGLPCKIVSIGVHRKKLVTVQRQLVNIQSGRTLQQTDVVHALDACLYYLLSNPKAPLPFNRSRCQQRSRAFTVVRADRSDQEKHTTGKGEQ